MGNHNPATAPVRFWSKVVQQGDCWVWTACTYRAGYGQFDKQYAHRWAYEHLRAEIPKGLQLDHLCRVRSCVNPWHLEPVTHAVNQARRTGYKTGPYNVGTHCRSGHERTPENTAVNAQGFRECRPCNREKAARHRQKRLSDTTQ